MSSLGETLIVIPREGHWLRRKASGGSKSLKGSCLGKADNQILLYVNDREIKMTHLTIPFNEKELRALKAGDEVLLTGDIYTARDQAHKRFADMLKKGVKMPLDLKGKAIYYCGPTKTPKGKVIGSCGPTTSSRMDLLTAPIFEAGVVAVIGKGRRSDEVRKLIKKHKGVYFMATGGAGALLSRKVIDSQTICFHDLGPEAVRKLTVKDFPVIVGIDSKGEDILKSQK